MSKTQQDMEQVARIAGRQLGAEQPPAEKPEADPNPTPQEQASAVGSPETEGDKSQMEAVIYEIEMNGNKRNLTPQQIASTFERYSKLNHQHAQMKPVLELAQQLMTATKGDPGKAANMMRNALSAMTKNTQLGNNRPKQEGVAAPQTQAPATANMDEQLAKYEEENAITLPPGYREQMAKLGQMEQMMGQQMKAMQMVLGQARQGAQEGSQAAQAAQADRMMVVQQSIANNLDRVQQKYGFADEEANDFMVFAGERGYTTEDFADINLLDRVANDYKSVKVSPEFERLKEQNARRQSFLRTQTSTPMGNAEAAKGGDNTLDRLAQNAMSRRNM